MNIAHILLPLVILQLTIIRCLGQYRPPNHLGIPSMSITAIDPMMPPLIAPSKKPNYGSHMNSNNNQGYCCPCSSCCSCSKEPQTNFDQDKVPSFTQEIPVDQPHYPSLSSGANNQSPGTFGMMTEINKRPFRPQSSMFGMNMFRLRNRIRPHSPEKYRDPLEFSSRHDLGNSSYGR